MAQEQQLATCCGNCMRKLRMAVEHQGRRVHCPHCLARLAVPTLDQCLDALPGRYVCDFEPGEEVLHESGPGSGGDPNDDTLIIDGLSPDESSANIPALDPANLPLLDDLLGLPDIDFGETPALKVPPAEGYAIEQDNVVVLYDASMPFMRRLVSIVKPLPASLRSPIRIDFRPLGSLHLSTVRRVLNAALTAQLLGKPTQLVLSAEQREWFGETSLDRLVRIADEPRKR